MQSGVWGIRFQEALAVKYAAISCLTGTEKLTNATRFRWQVPNEKLQLRGVSMVQLGEL